MIYMIFKLFNYVYFTKMAIDNSCVQVILALNIFQRNILTIFRKTNKKKGYEPD